MADIVQLKDRSTSTDQYPVTLTEAVVDASGAHLSQTLSDLPTIRSQAAAAYAPAASPVTSESSLDAADQVPFYDTSASSKKGTTLTALANKVKSLISSAFAAASHTHTKSQISDFPTSLPASDVSAWAKASSKPSYTWSEITSKPSTFTPASHSHTKSQISDFPTSLPASDVSAWAKATSKPTYTASEVGAAAASHTHTKSQISDFPTSLPASDVSAWAKATSKPTYTASEVGAAAASHTHSYAGSSSAGGAATSANKVNAALTFASSSGNAVGTTFDGSTARTISYNTVGAAAANHTHTVASLTGGGAVVSTDTTGTKPAGSIPAWSGSGNTITTQLGKGSATKPIYLDDGIPTACSFDLSGFQFSTASSGTTIGGSQTLTFDSDFELGAACEYAVTSSLNNTNSLITSAAVYAAIGDIESLLSAL